MNNKEILKRINRILECQELCFTFYGKCKEMYQGLVYLKTDIEEEIWE